MDTLKAPRTLSYPSWEKRLNSFIFTVPRIDSHFMHANLGLDLSYTSQIAYPEMSAAASGSGKIQD